MLLGAIGFALSLASAPAEPAAPSPPPAWFQGGSIVRAQRWHLGARPALDVSNDGGRSWALGMTLQLSCRVPW